MSDPYIHISASNDPDAFALLADGLSVGHLLLGDDGWRLGPAGPLTFEPVEIGLLDADDAQTAAVEWIRTHQRDELAEFLGYY